MANTLRIKRRTSGSPGAPSSLANAELAFNEVDNVLYYGKGTGGVGGTATSVDAIAGPGAFLTLSSTQTVSGNKTFTGDVSVPTQVSTDNSTKAASTAFVKAQGYLTANQSITFSGDASGSGTTSVTLTLASVGTAGTYTKVTTDAKGRVTSGTTLSAGDIPNLSASYLSVSGGTLSGNLTVGGDLTVNGTLTSINSTTVTVDDINIELGSTASPTDATSNGGGITLKGTTDKTITWLNATAAWTLSEHVDLASGKVYRIGGTQVLSSTALGSGVTSSSLTSVGTLSSGTWQAATIAVAYGGTGATTLTGYVKGNGTSAMTASATIPSTDISGLGTMSTQAASNVNITGGTIDNITFDGGTF